jgi:hypothetical protein
MLTMRLIGVRDYSVFKDRQHIGRIRGERESKNLHPAHLADVFPFLRRHWLH